MPKKTEFSEWSRKCPNSDCGKVISPDDSRLDKAIRNVDHYGEGSFVLVCPHCKKNYGVYLTRVVVLDHIRVADVGEESSFG